VNPTDDPGRQTLEAAISGAFAVTWLERRAMMSILRHGGSSPEKIELARGRYEGMLRALGDLLVHGGDKQILVRDPSVTKTHTEEGWPFITLVPCPDLTMKRLFAYAETHGMFNPELDEA
jgi:hypothetical protein